jgi:ketosteroid isomerase-like protein
MDSPTEVVLGAFSALEERDQEKLFALFHDDVELHEAPSLPYGGTTRGKGALRDQLATAPERTWLGTWGPLQPTEAERRMDPRVLASSGDEVVILYTQRAISRSGERFEAPVTGLYEVREGKLARAQMFHYDTAAVLAFLERAAQPGPLPSAA